jgi:O-methyltransferase involved in polyketide biosynthesis
MRRTVDQTLHVSGVEDVHGVPATMLITLSARALAHSVRPDMGFRDVRAEQLVATLGIDPQDFCSFPPALVATVYRSSVFDRVTRSFCAGHPGAAVINLACGLATTYERLEPNTAVSWVDVDLPEVIEIRRRFFPETAHRKAVAADLTDASAVEQLLVAADGRPTLVLLEGIVYYLDPHEVRNVFQQIADSHERSGADLEIALDIASPTGVALSNANNTDTRRSGSVMQWGCSGVSELQEWDPELELVELSDHQAFLPEGFAEMFAANKARDGVGPFAVVHLRRRLRSD